MVCDTICRHVVTSFIIHDNLILVLKRSKTVRSYVGKWAAVSGKVEKNESYIDAAYREISEEVGINKNNLKLMAEADVIKVPYADFVWVVHPFLFESSISKIILNWENECYKWITPQELILLDTVPELATAFYSLLANKNIF